MLVGQMLFGAFRPRTTREIKKVTASERSAMKTHPVTRRLVARSEKSLSRGPYITHAARSFSATET